MLIRTNMNKKKHRANNCSVLFYLATVRCGNLKPALSFDQDINPFKSLHGSKERIVDSQLDIHSKSLSAIIV